MVLTLENHLIMKGYYSKLINNKLKVLYTIERAPFPCKPVFKNKYYSCNCYNTKFNMLSK